MNLDFISETWPGLFRDIEVSEVILYIPCLIFFDFLLEIHVYFELMDMKWLKTSTLSFLELLD